MRTGTERRAWRLKTDEALYDEEDLEFRRGVWAFLESSLDEEIKGGAHQGGEIGGEWVDRAFEFMKKAVDFGLVTYSWPKEYGGEGGTRRRQAIVNEALGYFRAPLPWHTGVDIVAPALMIYGTAEQRARWLPAISSGEVTINNGLTEPDAGSDLANISTKAVLKGDNYEVTGHKTFQSRAHYATHSWVLVRTNQSSSGRKGLSLLLVDLHARGVTVAPQWNIAGGRQNDVYFDAVKVPKDNLLGDENDGWSNLRLSLGFERSGVHEYARLQGFVDELRDYVAAAGSPFDEAAIAKKIDEMEIGLAEWRELCYMVVDRYELDFDIGLDASIATLKQKVTAPALSEAACQLIGPSVFWSDPDRQGEPTDQTRRNFASLYWESRSYHARGTPEIQKNTIARLGLSMPKE